MASKQPQRSPMLEAEEVLHVALHFLRLDELLAHRARASGALLMLTQARHAIPMSAPARAAITVYLRKLADHLDQLHDLIEDKRVEEAHMAAEAARLAADDRPAAAGRAPGRR